MTKSARVKPLPPAPDELEGLWDVCRVIPLVPRGEEDCCTRLVVRGDVPSRDLARTWLSFLEGLGLVAERDGQFHRTRRESEQGDLAIAFVDGVFGAVEVLDILDRAGPLAAGAAFERFEPSVPHWERSRDPDWRASWRRRTGDLLEWLVLLGCVERTPEGYASS